jgi:hypothetical protein
LQQVKFAVQGSDTTEVPGGANDGQKKEKNQE